MKTLTLTLVLLLMAAAGYAQTANQKPSQFPSIESKPLNLQYIGKDTTSVLERIGYDGLGKSPLSESSAAGESGTEAAPVLPYKMPVMRPNPAIDFQILAIKPDSTFFYHLRVKQPE